MNISEKKACHWMMSYAKLEPEQIKWNGADSPDFLCTDGRSFEVKTLNGHSISIGESQYPKLLKCPRCTILVFNSHDLLPIAQIPVTHIIQGLMEIDGIRIVIQKQPKRQEWISKDIIRQEHKALFAMPMTITTQFIRRNQPSRSFVLITPEAL